MVATVIWFVAAAIWFIGASYWFRAHQPAAGVASLVGGTVCLLAAAVVA